MASLAWQAVPVRQTSRILVTVAAGLLAVGLTGCKGSDDTSSDETPTDRLTAAKRAAKVVVIPDRGRFHTPSCRFVRGVDTTEELTKAAATRQGYQACGVCKP